jgi:hypothetical protein
VIVQAGAFDVGGGFGLLGLRRCQRSLRLLNLVARLQLLIPERRFCLPDPRR